MKLTTILRNLKSKNIIASEVISEISSSLNNDTILPNAMSKRCSEGFNQVRNHLGASILGERLQGALDALLKGYPRRKLRQSAALLSDASTRMTQISSATLLESGLEDSPAWSEVRKQAIIQYSSPAVEYGLEEAYAYVASQMPFALAPLERVFGEIGRLRPDFQPESMLDFGCGPGTGIFAAHEQWSRSLRQFMGVDVSQAMLDVGKELNQASYGLPIVWRRFMAVAEDRPKYDLVLQSGVLGELADDGLRKQAVQHLWDQTGKIMVLIERGNAEGFRLIRNARQQLLDSADDFNIIAPCAHHEACPMKGSWCHFSQRVQLTSLQNELFNLPKGFEDQKFTYLVVERKERSRDNNNLPRLIRPPIKRSGHVIQDACMPDGKIERFVVAKSAGPQVFYDARKSQWGDSWPHPIRTARRVLDNLAKTPKDYPRRRPADGKALNSIFKKYTKKE